MLKKIVSICSAALLSVGLLTTSLAASAADSYTEISDVTGKAYYADFVWGEWYFNWNADKAQSLSGGKLNAALTTGENYTHGDLVMLALDEAVTFQKIVLKASAKGQIPYKIKLEYSADAFPAEPGIPGNAATVVDQYKDFYDAESDTITYVFPEAVTAKCVWVQALTDGEGNETGTVNWTVAEARFYKASESGGDNDNSDASTPEKPETLPEKPVENKVVENTAGGKAYYAVIGTDAVTFSEPATVASGVLSTAVGTADGANYKNNDFMMITYDKAVKVNKIVIKAAAGQFPDAFKVQYRPAEHANPEDLTGWNGITNLADVGMTFKVDGDTVEITLDTQIEANALLIQAQEHDGENTWKVSEIHTYHTAGGAPATGSEFPIAVVCLLGISTVAALVLSKKKA